MMEQNLERLAAEIEQYLHAESFIVFHSTSRMHEDRRIVFWDHRRVPDYQRFLECAQQVGVRLVHLHERTFDAEQKETALEILEEADLTRDERRDMQRRIEAMSRYEGKLCALELSFDFEGRIYMYAVETEWFAEWESILDDLEAAGPENEDEDSYGGFYSNN
ncbi:MAG: hypothetical protein N2036_12000 [Bryobacteraceae bacterium]|nr:hypothetical protein [Bryobacteraceae bacterium]MCX7604789.1 hypothetical protein [Bryobacteraceae bacterium]